MARAYSTDLRLRVIQAIDGGLSGRRRLVSPLASRLLGLGTVDENLLDVSQESKQPIENAFSRVKATLRKAAARTLDDLWAVIAAAPDAFTPDECINYFAACEHNPA